MLHKFGRIAIVLAAWACQAATAADRQLEIAPIKLPAGGEKRIALVIGNSAYKSAPLRNPVNDARAIARALAGTGFEVTELEDATQAGMVRAIRKFGDELAAGGVGLFYYAGHGIQVGGRNYLVPVNADIEREDEIEFNAVDANFVVAKMDTAKNGMNVLILDACRNNPFARSFRSATQGLAQMDAPSGTMIAFATAPGSVAADGDGQHGLYTKHLLENLGKRGLPIEEVFKAVRNGVARDTGERQIPWESSSLRGDFYFVPPDPSQSPEAQKAAMQRAVAEAVKQEQEKAAAELAAQQREMTEQQKKMEEQQKKMQETIRDLLAKQRAQLEEEMRRRGETLAAAPLPSAQPASSLPAEPKPEAGKPVQVASIEPASVAPDVRFPKVGDHWDYVYRDELSRQSRRLRYEIFGVSKEGILEQGGFEDGPVRARAHSAMKEIAFDELWNFSPYLLAFGELAPGQKWGPIPYSNLPACQFAGASCRFDATVAGKETVTTPAGSFETVKVVIDLNARGIAGGGSASWPTWRQLTLWYSQKAKRFVKATVRTLTTAGNDADYDLELVSYKLH